MTHPFLHSAEQRGTVGFKDGFRMEYGPGESFSSKKFDGLRRIYELVFNERKGSCICACLIHGGGYLLRAAFEGVALEGL